jgi:hypothetical protein
MLRPLSLTRLGIILLPRKASLLPAFIHCIDEILAEIGVQLLSLGLIGSLLLSEELRKILVGRWGRTE